MTEEIIHHANPSDPSVRVAPWTAEEVANLKRRQGVDHLHPYTCRCGDVLIPTVDGWTCVKGHYRQDWCHRVDAEGNWPPAFHWPPIELESEPEDEGLRQQTEQEMREFTTAITAMNKQFQQILIKESRKMMWQGPLILLAFTGMAGVTLWKEGIWNAGNIILILSMAWAYYAIIKSMVQARRSMKGCIAKIEELDKELREDQP